MVDKVDEAANRNSGTLLAILLIIQMVILPGLGWIFLKIDTMQDSSNKMNSSVAVFSDRQIRQGKDIAEIKNTLKGVETKDAAHDAHQKIWQTDQDQYDRLDELRQGQQSLKSRVQKLETQFEGRGR
ncbi:hypothetical protein V5738_10945 [Salinisphaera sp. SPP-AMP-43]|uniref:hypothetical protein n=1 Tax=Salinisphaera sp. SPP-AMP-43 TaxID=3121288 RepID=UPI003C6DCE65